MLALTVWPEWAWAFLLPPPLRKLTENRTWLPDGRLRPGDTMALHAGIHRGSPHARDWGYRLDAVTGMALREQRRCEAWGHAERPRLKTGYSRMRGIFLTLDGEPVPAPMGAVVALVTYLGCDREQRTGYDVPGDWHWRFADLRPLHMVVPCRGFQGLWRLPLNVECRVDEALRA